MQLSLRRSIRILLGNMRAEIDVGFQRFPERLVIGQVSLIGRLHIQINKTLPLLLCNVEPSVNIDQMPESSHWDGSDLFIAEGTLAIMCTEKIRNILVKNKVTNLIFERLDTMEWYSI